jgi:hypothetical protein
MRKVFATAAALSLMAGAAMAQGTDGMWANQTDQGDWQVFGPDSTDGSDVIVTTDGLKPADCASGAFYQGPNDSIISCDDDLHFGMVQPETGSMMPSGEPWPQGAMMLEYREDMGQEGTSN